MSGRKHCQISCKRLTTLEWGHGVSCRTRRSLGAGADQRQVEWLGEKLLAMGWHREAQSFARSLPQGMTVEFALDLERRAGLARSSLKDLLSLFQDLDRDEARVAGNETRTGKSSNP